MHGGGEAAIITEWKRLAEQEPDGVLRSAYAVLALTFAELTKGLVTNQHNDAAGGDLVAAYKWYNLVTGHNGCPFNSQIVPFRARSLD